MADPTAVPTHKGIRCPNPNCQAIGGFKTGQQKKETDALHRPKTCKVCGTVFMTLEVPTSVVEIKNLHVSA